MWRDRQPNDERGNGLKTTQLPNNSKEKEKTIQANNKEGVRNDRKVQRGKTRKGVLCILLCVIQKMAKNHALTIKVYQSCDEVQGDSAVPNAPTIWFANLSRQIAKFVSQLRAKRELMSNGRHFSDSKKECFSATPFKCVVSHSYMVRKSAVHYPCVYVTKIEMGRFRIKRS